MSLKVNDLYLNDDLSIANCMNSYFSLVFTVEDHENFPYNIFVLPLKLNDCISLCILRERTQMLSSPLAIFLIILFSHGQLPCVWKLAHITPVHKKGNKNLMENFRQISLTCIVCKIAEAVVRTCVVDFGERIGIFKELEMPTHCCVPECTKKGYREDGTKVSSLIFSIENPMKKWLHVIRRQVRCSIPAKNQLESSTFNLTCYH